MYSLSAPIYIHSVLVIVIQPNSFTKKYSIDMMIYTATYPNHLLIFSNVIVGVVAFTYLYKSTPADNIYTVYIFLEEI